MSVLCTNAHLFDIEQLCADSVHFSPISTHPTFDLFDFCVTVIN